MAEKNIQALFLKRLGGMVASLKKHPDSKGMIFKVEITIEHSGHVTRKHSIEKLPNPSTTLYPWNQAEYERLRDIASLLVAAHIWCQFEYSIWECAYRRQRGQLARKRHWDTVKKLVPEIRDASYKRIRARLGKALNEFK